MYERVRNSIKSEFRIIFVSVLILLTSFSGANAEDSSILSSGNITLKLIDIFDETGDVIRINYGDTMKVRVVYPADKNSVQYLDLLDRDYSNNLIERYVLDSSGFQIVSIPASTYAPAVNFTLRVYAEKTGEELRTDNLSKIILARTSRPSISLTIKNPSTEVAEGDFVKIYGTITTSEYTWALNGPYDRSKFFELANNVTAGGTQTVNPGDEDATVTNEEHRIELSIPTDTILSSCGGTTGKYTLKVWNAAYPNTDEEVDFRISEINAVLSADKETLRLGETLKIEGSTNAAETNSDYDDSGIGQNTVEIKLFSETGAGNLIAQDTVNIKSDGTFQKEIEFSLEWEYDTTYELRANVTTGNGYFNEEIQYIEVRPPQVEFIMGTATPEVTAEETAIEETTGEVTEEVTETPEEIGTPLITATEIPPAETTTLKTPHTPTITPVTEETTKEVEIPGFQLLYTVLALTTVFFITGRGKSN